MSRPRLRSRVSSVTVSGSPTSTTAEILSSSQISNYAHQQTVHTESHQETYSGSSSWQNRKNIDISGMLYDALDCKYLASTVIRCCSGVLFSRGVM